MDYPAQFQFNKLPPEIRCMIWKTTISEPRLVKYRNTPVPMVLQVNQESRYEALKVLKLLYAPKYGAYRLRSRTLLGHEHQDLYPTYVNPVTDVLDLTGVGFIDRHMRHTDTCDTRAILLTDINLYQVGFVGFWHRRIERLESLASSIKTIRPWILTGGLHLPYTRREGLWPEHLANSKLWIKCKSKRISYGVLEPENITHFQLKKEFGCEIELDMIPKNLVV